MSPRPPLPAGYGWRRERGVIVAALPSAMQPVLDAVRERGTLYAWAAAQPDAAAFSGRGAAYGVGVDGDEWVVRHYRRGGLVGRIIDDSYVRMGEPRPLRELRASAALRARGVPTPQVVAAVVYAAGALYRGDLATRFIANSADLAAVTWGGAGLAGADSVAAWRAAGLLLRRTFDAGVIHPDLNLRNILIARGSDGDIAAWLLDLDRARVREPHDVAARTMLERFHRSRRKLETLHGAPVGATELTAFADALHTNGGRAPSADEATQ